MRGLFAYIPSFFRQMTSTTPILYPRLLLTGAAGGLGRVLRPRLKPHCQTLRVSDISELGAANAGEEVMPVPLQDAQAVDKLLGHLVRARA